MDLKRIMIHLKKTLDEIKEDNKSLIKRVITLEENDTDKQKKLEDLTNRVNKIDDQMDSFEQYSKIDNLIITGLKVFRPYNATALLVGDQQRREMDDEGKEEWNGRDKDILTENFIRFAKDKLDVTIDSHDISDIHTLPKNHEKKTDTCIVRFTNRTVRDKIIRNRSKLKTTSRSAPKIYINEHLTKRNGQIAKQARLMQKNGDLLGTWTKNCRIYVKKLDERITRIQSLSELDGI